jgi:drug/metabolite transporter (DMT)-like permease
MNTLAVIVFFLGIKYTTITKANILNLTYPIFVFIVSPYITGEKANRKDYIFLAFSLIGAWFIIIPGGGFNGFGSVNVGDMLCLLSGLISGFGISYLRQARKFDSAPMILTYQMAIGTVLCFFTMLPGFAMPSTKGLLFVAITATLTVFGQFFITEGYMYVSAALGSVVSGSGILFAAMFGILFFNDPITINIVIGGGFILLALFGAGKFFEKAKQYLPFFD